MATAADSPVRLPQEQPEQAEQVRKRSLLKALLLSPDEGGDTASDAGQHDKYE